MPVRRPAADWRVQAARAEYREALAAAVLEGWRAECARLGADDLVLLGDVARLAGDLDRAEEAYRSARRRFPDADRPIYALGLIAFEGRHNYKLAGDLFGSYLRSFPRGPLAREAAGRLIESRLKAGDDLEARRAAGAYLHDFPGGPLRRTGQTHGRSVIRGRGGIQAAVAFALLAAAAAVRAGSELPAVAALPEVPDRTPRVALLSAVANDPLAGRIDAELRAVGVDVSRAAIAPSVGIEEQVRAALVAGARAVVVADGHRTDVWIAQDGSDRVGLRQELEVDETSGLQAVLALRTVEFLRISLGLVSEPNIVPLVAAPPIVASAGSHGAGAQTLADRRRVVRRAGQRGRRWSDRHRRRQPPRAALENPGGRALLLRAAHRGAAGERGRRGAHVGVAGRRRAGARAAT